MMALLLACTGELADERLDEGLVTRVEVDEAITVHLEAPGADGLEVPPVEGLQVEVVEISEGAWDIVYSGPPGSYILEPVQVHAGGEAVPGPRYYVDLGVQGPSSDLNPLASMTPIEERPIWPWFLALAVTGFTAGGVITGVLIWRNRDTSAPPPPPIPPDVEALGALNAAVDAGLDDHAFALAISAVFRRYVERITGEPATARTSFEVLASLDERFDPEMSKKLLTATDLIKFAREQGSAELFAELVAGLRAIIIATRPAPE